MVRTTHTRVVVHLSDTGCRGDAAWGASDAGVRFFVAFQTTALLGAVTTWQAGVRRGVTVGQTWATTCA